MIEIEKKIKLLKDYFSKKMPVSMAFVFGSYARECYTDDSDFDIAIYFKPDSRMLEWEESKLYKDEDLIWNDVERIIGIETDFVVLNRAPSNLALSIITGGIPVIIKDRSLYLRFYLMISSASEDMRKFTKDFWIIKQRSLSISEIDKERLIRIVDFFETELQDYSQFTGLTRYIYETDSTIRRNVERWVENIVNSSIDIAKIILASEKMKIPQTYREILLELSLLDNFSGDIAKELSRFSRLRNILAHEYLDIRYIQIDIFIKEAENAYKMLLDFVKNYLQ